jgi:hypothetical protein
MSSRANSQDRLLDASELDLVRATRSPAIGQLSMIKLRTLIHRLRKALDRAKDISARQRREMRGKVDPRRSKRVRDNTASMAKVRLLSEAIKRFDQELLRRERNNTGTANQAELSRRVLEQKLSSPTKRYPNPGRTASKGMRQKERKNPVRIGTTRKEIGRVSKAGKVAQARKDARKG